MVRLVHRGIPAGGVGLEAVLLETGSGVFVWRLQHDVNAPAQIAEYGPAVALERRDDLDHAVLLEDAARFGCAQNIRQIIDSARREAETVCRHREPRGV